MGAEARLLMALVRIRWGSTFSWMGDFFGVHRRNAQLATREAVEAIESIADDATPVSSPPNAKSLNLRELLKLLRDLAADRVADR